MTARPVLHVLIGPPAAGKSTYARQTFPREWIVCADEVRQSVSGAGDPLGSLERFAPVKLQVMRAMARALGRRLAAGLDAVYDNTNILRSNRETLLRSLPSGIDVKYVVFDRPLAAKLADRGWRPEALVVEQHRIFQAELPAILAGDQRSFVAVEDRRAPGCARTLGAP